MACRAGLLGALVLPWATQQPIISPLTQQWGSFQTPRERRSLRNCRRDFSSECSVLTTPKTNSGPYAGLIQLGCNQDTQAAWQNLLDQLLQNLETHLQSHDYLLGGRPSLADFSLLGPIYVHFFRDPVPGFDLRTKYPLVSEWVERTNAENCLNARRYGHKYYGLNADGELEERQVLSDQGDWLAADQVPQTLEPILAIFFDEMWPYLKTSIDALNLFSQRRAPIG